MTLFQGFQEKSNVCHKRQLILVCSRNGRWCDFFGIAWSKEIHFFVKKLLVI